MDARLAALTCLLISLMACQPRGPDRPHSSLGKDLSHFRAAFNADSGKVRVVMLVSPT